MPLKPLPSNSCRFEGCTLIGALSVTTSVSDSVSVVHGPAGCAHHTFSLLHTLALDRGDFALPRLVSSGMQDTEIVFGGEDALRTAIRSAVSRDVSSVFVLSTCIAETIGDDVAAVCGEVRGIPVIPVPTAGFLGGTFQKGVNNALAAIAGIPPLPDDTATRGRVNIIGEKNLEYEVEENYAEVVRLLALLGLEVNLRFVRRIRTGEVAKLGSASLNILREEGMEELGHHLGRKFNIPAFTSFPTGLAGTVAFLNTAAGACGVDPGKAVAKERELQAALIGEFADIAGSSITFDPLPGTGDISTVREVIALLALTVKPDGTPVPLPHAPPVGTGGIGRMLHRWRRALHA